MTRKKIAVIAGALALGVASHLAMDVIPHWGLPHGLTRQDRDRRYLQIARRDGGFVV